jgi:hypothetical protein
VNRFVAALCARRSLAMDDRLSKIYQTGHLAGLKALYAPDYLGYWAGQGAQPQLAEGRIRGFARRDAQ